jgi:hypothetical protein
MTFCDFEGSVMSTNFQQNRSSACAAAVTQQRKWVRKLALVPVAALVTSGAFAASAEPSKGLAGSWSGGGWVSFSSGTKEKARCRASYKAMSKDSFAVHATFATSSGKASQTATVYKVSASSYKGSFYNTDFNVRGTIRVTVNGSSQQVSLAGDGASASLSLRRR